MAGSKEHMDEFYEDSDDQDDDEITMENGSVVQVPPVDRYGFMGGAQYTNPDTEVRLPMEILRKRELKWLDMLENWEKWMSKKFKKVKVRCRKGIPPSLRGRAWQFLCGSKFYMDRHHGKYQEYLHQTPDPKWVDEITRDLHRQFPLHEMFAARGGTGQEDLFNILIAYTNHNPIEGYCQAQGPVAAVLLMHISSWQEDLFNILIAYTNHNPIEGYCQAQGPVAAVLLMHMPAEQAFWCLVAICEKYMPGYYSLGLEAVQVDGDVLFGLLKKVLPATYKHLKKQSVAPILYMTEWFMCLFARTLPWSCVLRMWDIFLCEGVKVLFRVALVLFKITLGSPEHIKECPTLYEIIEKLKHIPVDQLGEEIIIRESLRLPITERDMEKEHRKQLDKRRKEQLALQPQTQNTKKSSRKSKR